MLKARWFRVMVAVVLATWSPGTMYCCCTARAETPQTPGHCEVAAQTQTHSCCAAEGVTAEPAALAPTCTTGCTDRDPMERSCGCVHGPTDAPVPAVTALPGLGKHGLADMDLLVQLPPALVLRHQPVRYGVCCRGAPHGPPAQRSLLALGCLLTV